MERDGDTIIGEYENISSIININFTCKCGEDTIRPFRYIVEKNGAFCEECISKITERIKFNKKLLNKHIMNDRAKLIGEYDILTNGTNIKFLCECGEENIKKFSNIVELSGEFCKQCTEKNKIEKQKKTNLEKYGVEITSQNDDVKKK